MLKKEVIMYLDGRTTYERDREIIKCSFNAHELQFTIDCIVSNRNIGEK